MKRKCDCNNQDKIINYISRNSVCIGYSCIYIISEDGDIYECGSNSFRTSFIPTIVNLPYNEKAIYVASGRSHVCCITEQYNMYTWGDNSNGQLGLDDNKNRSSPTLLNFPNNEKMKFLSCGGFHTVCITKNENIYSWGSNIYGQLGLSGNYHFNNTPSLLTLPNNERVDFLRSGKDHVISYTKQGNIYVWGDNWYGQLGLGDKNNRLSPTLLNLPNNETFHFSSCGGAHTVFITKKGNMYICGSDIYGELGLDEHTDTQPRPNDTYGELDLDEHTNTQPRRGLIHLLTLPSNEKVSFVDCGDHYTICITVTGKLYGWGDNITHCLGLEDNFRYHHPFLLTLPNNEKPLILKCGYDNTVLISENKHLYIWGSNKYGQLGIDNNSIEFYRSTSEIIDRDYSLIKGFSDEKRVRIIKSKTIWNKFVHNYISSATKAVIKTCLLLALKNKKTEKPLYPQTLFHLLPKEILLYIFEFLPLF